MIREGVAAVLRELLKIEDIPFNVPPRRELGDFSSPMCLSLAKPRRESPMKMGQELAERLRSTPPLYIKEIGISPPGYLNFKVDWSGLAQDLVPRVLQEGKSFGKPMSQPGKKVFIEPRQGTTA